MKDALTREVLQQMLPFMDNEQAMRLQKVLDNVLTKYEINETTNAPVMESTNEQMVTKFIEAKRIEGCSEKHWRIIAKPLMPCWMMSARKLCT